MIFKTFSFQTTGVGSAVIDDDASDEVIYNTLYLAATIEEGNGDGKIRTRPNKTVDDRSRG